MAVSPHAPACSRHEAKGQEQSTHFRGNENNGHQPCSAGEPPGLAGAPTLNGPAGERLYQGKQGVPPIPLSLLSEDEAEAGKPAGDPVPWSPGWHLGRPSESLRRRPLWKDWTPQVGAAGQWSPGEGTAGAMGSQEARMRHQSSLGWLAMSTWKKALLSPQEMQM